MEKPFPMEKPSPMEKTLPMEKPSPIGKMLPAGLRKGETHYEGPSAIHIPEPEKQQKDHLLLYL
mgnify:FL=1